MYVPLKQTFLFLGENVISKAHIAENRGLYSEQQVRIER